MNATLCQVVVYVFLTIIILFYLRYCGGVLSLLHQLVRKVMISPSDSIGITIFNIIFLMGLQNTYI